MLTHLIHRMAWVRQRVSRKLLMAFMGWVPKSSLPPITPSHTRHVRRYRRAVPVPSRGRKKVVADFDGRRLTSEGGVMLLAAAERRLGIADRLAGLIADPRNPLFVTHGVAYWLMLTVRDAIPKPQPPATAEFTTLRLRLLKVAGRITETAARVRIALASACPEAELFRGVARSLGSWPLSMIQGWPRRWRRRAT